MTPSNSKVRTPARTPRDWTPDTIARERSRLQIPDDPIARRNWLRYQLGLKGWTQKRLAQLTNASESSVSVIYIGGRTEGEKADRVRAVTAEILSIPEPVLFPEAHTRKAS